MPRDRRPPVSHDTQCHGCMPLTGNDPNWALARFIVELRQLENFEKDRLGRHEFLGWPSFTPTVLQAPVTGVAQLNVVPKEASLALDVRTVPIPEEEQQYQNRQNPSYDEILSNASAVDRKSVV